MSVETQSELPSWLRDKATRLRIHSIRATTEAGSGHPTSCASAAEILAALFFSVMRYDPKDPANPANDVFILSKGHAAPVLYAAWAEAGYIPEAELLNLRKIDSDLEGHPPTTLPFVDLATGSLGQGLSAGLGMALNARVDGRDQRIYVLLGDGESAEGSVWEAAAMASHLSVNNLCATIDVNRLGQSEPTMLQHDMDTYGNRWESFGWQALVVDGHDVEELVGAYEKAAATTGRPTRCFGEDLQGQGHRFRGRQERLARQTLGQGRAGRRRHCGAASATEQFQLPAGRRSCRLRTAQRRRRRRPFPRPPIRWETRSQRGRHSGKRWRRWQR